MNCKVSNKPIDIPECNFFQSDSKSRVYHSSNTTLALIFSVVLTINVIILAFTLGITHPGTLFLIFLMIISCIFAGFSYYQKIHFEKRHKTCWDAVNAC